MCIYGRHMCICLPNMKFLCLNLCQGEVCTDNANDDTNDDDANANDDGQSMIVKCSLVDKPNEPKIPKHFCDETKLMLLNTYRTIRPPP